MKLTREFTRDLNRIDGDGTRAAKFAFFNPAREAAKELSSHSVIENFGNVICKYGRPTVGMCVAATVVARQDRLHRETVEWGREVLSHWHNKTQSNVDSLVINDGLHPTRIEQYAALFISSTIAD